MSLLPHPWASPKPTPEPRPLANQYTPPNPALVGKGQAPSMVKGMDPRPGGGRSISLAMFQTWEVASPTTSIRIDRLGLEGSLTQATPQTERDGGDDCHKAIAPPNKKDP